MRRCVNCGFETDSGAISCQLCGHRFPILSGISDLTIRRAGITVLVPVLVWIVMSRLLGI